MKTDIMLQNEQTQQIDRSLLVWLDAKKGRSQSEGTRRKYHNNLRNFRALLNQAGLDLDADRATIRVLAQGWAGRRWSGNLTEPVSNATYEQRLASLSSWYEFVIVQELVTGIERNPIKAMERRATENYQGAQPLSTEDVAQSLAAIPRKTPADERDYVILSLGFATGRRVSELQGLRIGDLTFSGTLSVRVFWRRTKGGKSHTDTIDDREMVKLLRGWICQVYGSLKAAPKDAALWPSASNNNKGQPISTRAIADICYKHIGTYETHTMRHTFTKAMKDQGASDEEVGENLLHAPGSRNTRKYIRKVMGQSNKRGQAIRQGFGIKAKENA